MILHSKQSINEKLPYYAFRMNRPTVFENVLNKLYNKIQRKNIDERR